MKTAVRIRINSISSSSRGSRSEASFGSKDVIKDIESFKYNQGTDVVAAIPNCTTSGALACRAWACTRRDGGASSTMSCLARRTLGMEGIADRTRIKRSRKLQSLQDARFFLRDRMNESRTSETKTKKEHEKKKTKQKYDQQRKKMRKTSCLPEYVV